MLSYPSGLLFSNCNSVFDSLFPALELDSLRRRSQLGPDGTGSFVDVRVEARVVANASDLDFSNAVHVDETTRDDLVAVVRVTVAQIEVVDGLHMKA